MDRGTSAYAVEAHSAQDVAAAVTFAKAHRIRLVIKGTGHDFNKGLGGASPEAVQRNRETAMNPIVVDAAALVIAASGEVAHPGVPGHEPDRARAAAEKAEITAAMAILRRATPQGGSYVNETDYFEPAWQRAFWGANYDRLLAIKRRVDPDNLFTCHHCVGSE